MQTRSNKGKPKLGLVFHMPYALEGLARILEWGERKYTPTKERGWLNYKADDTLDSLMRHVQAIQNGEVYDEETGMPHAYSMVFNACMYTELTACDFLPETYHDPDS